MRIKKRQGCIPACLYRIQEPCGNKNAGRGLCPACKQTLQKVSLCTDGHSMSHTHATHLATEHHVTEHAAYLPEIISMLFYSTMSIMSIDNKNFTHCALNNCFYPSANQGYRAVNQSNRHSAHLPHRSLTTSPAMISPATEGTNAVEPGISLRTVHFRVPGGQMQCFRQLMDGSSSGRVGCSVE